MRNEYTIELKKVIEEDYGNVAGIIITRNNKVVFEHYYKDYTAADTIHIASVTKSIISILIGIALEKGFIQGIDQKVLEFFPDYDIKRGEKTIQNVTLENLLTMTAPYKFKSEPYKKVYSDNDWTRASLDLLGGKGTTGDFKYTTVALHILSGILVNATGQSVLDFAHENLFIPLGINKPPHKAILSKEDHFAFLKGRTVSGWVMDPKGVHTAGWGLALSTKDMVKFGQLYANKGMWENEEIVSSAWIEESTKEQSLWGDIPYGYLWWVIKGFPSDCYAAIGDGGNIIFIYPEKNIVVAITSSFMPRAKDRIELIRNHILPMMGVS